MDWRHDAACRGHDPEVFFPTGATAPVWDEIQRAKAVCRRCPVREHCLHWAVDNGQDTGVWGGLTEQERRACGRRHGAHLLEEPHQASGS